MEKVKFLPDEIDKMIDDEIARIDAANSEIGSVAAQQRQAEPRSPLRRILRRLREAFAGRNKSKP